MLKILEVTKHLNVFENTKVLDEGQGKHYCFMLATIQGELKRSYKKSFLEEMKKLMEHIQL